MIPSEHFQSVELLPPFPALHSLRSVRVPRSDQDSVGELTLVSRRLLAVRIGGTESVTPAPGPGSHFSPALVAFFASTAPFLASRAQFEVHLRPDCNPAWVWGEKSDFYCEATLPPACRGLRSAW